MEQLDASTLARWAAEPALYETPGKLETANDDWQRGVLRLSASGVVFCDDGRAARGMALDSVVRVTVGERKRFLKKARLTVELQGAAGTCAFDARDAFRRDAFAKACGALGAMRVADDDAAAVDAGDGKLLADAARVRLKTPRRRRERDAHGPLVPLQPRAGASGLVSPEDFADACGRYLDRRSPDFSRDAPATLRVFRSGVKVVALADDDTRARVVAHAAGGATAMGLAICEFSTVPHRVQACPH
ncbi:hypothetical protein JL722_14647 [Aureococcus anophagefferens]|nr:hypothetical protein JL722_14647 [Aureococcus anophagefferens]